MQSGVVLDMLFILLAGLCGGFASSAPLGAINLWISDATLRHREDRLSWFIVGVILMDTIHASLAAWGYHAFLQDGPVGRWLSIAGGAFLIVIGSLSFLKRNAARQREAEAQGKGPEPKRRKVNDFILGAFMCGANPAFLMFWVFAVGLIEKHVGIPVNSTGLALFLGGIAFGDGLWFLLLIRLVRKGREAFKPRVLASVRATIAMAFVVVGTIAIYHGFH